MDIRKAVKILNDNGFRYERSKGDHDIYVKDGKHITIPYKSKGINKMLWRRLVKENGLNE